MAIIKKIAVDQQVREKIAALESEIQHHTYVCRLKRS